GLDEGTIAGLEGHLGRILEGVVEEGRVGDLDLLTAAEEQELLVGWNATGREYPQEKTIGELFTEQARAHPEAEAVRFEGRSLSYGELEARSNQLAHHLRSLGVGPEVRVGIFLERSLEMVVGILGVLKAGGAYVPLDPSYPAERLAFMLGDAAVTVLLTQAHVAGALPEHGARLVLLDADWARVAAESTAACPSGV